MTKRFNIDYSRKERLGFEEVIFEASKSVDLLIELLNEVHWKKTKCIDNKIATRKGDKIARIV